MSPSTVLQDLQAMRDRVEGEDKVALEQAVALIERMGEQLVGLKWMASQRFRRSSEKVAPGQLAMDFIEHLVREEQERVKDDATAEPAPKPEPRPKRKSGIKLLPVRTVEKTLPAPDLQCECGCTKQNIGFDTRRQVVYEPPQLFMEEERLHKYACRACAAGVVMAPAKPKLIDGSLASSSLLAHLTVSKVIDCTPIERIGKQLARHDANLSPSTMYDWFAYAAQEVGRLQPFIRAELLASKLISLDDTPLPTKNVDIKNKIQRGRLWLYLGDLDRIAYCAFQKIGKASTRAVSLRNSEAIFKAMGTGASMLSFMESPLPSASDATTTPGGNLSKR